MERCGAVMMLFSELLPAARRFEIYDTDGSLPMTLPAILMIERPEMSVIFRCDDAAACKRSISN